MNLANQILPIVKKLPDDVIDDNPLVIVNEDDFGKLNNENCSSVMNAGSFNEMYKELILNDYPHVQFIHILSSSFQNVSSLTISNLPELKFLIIEDNSFYSTTSLTLSSIF